MKSHAVLDFDQAVKLQEWGINLAESARHDWVAIAREVAKAYARRHGRVQMDDVIGIIGMPPGDSHNACGAVFWKREFIFLEFGVSKNPSRHRGTQRVWGIK